MQRLYGGVCECLHVCVCSEKTCCCPLSPPVCLSTDFSTYSLFLFPVEKQSIRSRPIRMCHGGHILFIIISSSDSKEQKLCDCWGKEMLNNWEIKCLKRPYCDEPPPANFISYSALCLLFSPSPAIALAQLCTSSSPLTTPDYKIKSALNPVNTTFRLRKRYSAMALHHQLYGN